MPAEKRTPVCKVSVAGSPLGNDDQAMLVRAQVELDAELIAQGTLLFLDPEMKLINGNTFESGKQIELKMGYDAKAQPVFSGEVVRLEPQFRRDEPVALKVVCQDSLHRLALSPMTRAFNDSDVSDVMNAIAQEHGLSVDAPTGTKTHIMQNNISDAEFLKRFASKLGLQLKLDGTKLTLGDPPSTTAIPLALGDGVKKLKVKRKSQAQVSDVSVHGYDSKTKQEIVGKAQPAGSTGDGAKKYGKGTLSAADGALLPPDQATADKMAKGLMNKIAEEYATLEADLIGDCRFTPGQTIEVDKLGQGTDGNYRIDKATHLFNKHGYYVKFEAVYTGPKTTPAPPKPAPQKYEPPKPAEGKLVRPRWKRRAQGDKDVADMSVDAPGKALDGKTVAFTLESKITGEWKQVAKGEGTVSKGFANATADLDPVPAADVISNPKWTTADHEHGQKGEVEITSKVKKPHDLRVILEQQIGTGSPVWEELDEQIVKVSGGTAKATFDLEHPHSQEAAKKHSEMLKNPVWQQPPKGKEGPGHISVEAPGLDDGRKVRLIAERLGRDGKWSAIKTVEALVKNHKAEAMLDLLHTIEKPQKADSKLLKAPKWEKADLAHGDMGELSVEAPNMDGQRVRFIVERNDGGTWTAVGERTVKVAGGKATTKMPLKHSNPDGKGGDKLPEAKLDPKTGIASIDLSPQQNGSKVSFIAEKKTPKGWVQVGTASAVVKDAKASAKITAPRKEGKLEKPAWSTPSAVHGDDVQVSVTAKDLDGSVVAFVIERLDGKTWVEAGKAKATVKGGKATAKITLAHPGADKKAPTAADLKAKRLRFRASLVGGETIRVRAEQQPDIDAKKLRFRAEAVPDVGAQKLRFRAEPIPDLRPRKLRFRTEVPIPENPALTRLKAEVKGGKPEDAVMTGGSGGE